MACRLQCLECGIAFYGRADAHYGCGACRQKSYRTRLAHHAAVERRFASEAARVQARKTRQKARASRPAHGMRELAHGLLHRSRPQDHLQPPRPPELIRAQSTTNPAPTAAPAAAPATATGESGVVTALRRQLRAQEQH